MAKVLQNLLMSEEPLFAHALRRLEQATGNDNVDIRLIADMTHQAHEVMRHIGLDTGDTTARELYHALNAYVLRESETEVLYGVDYVLMQIDGDIVSLNLIDVIENAHHELPFEQRMYSHGQRALRGEIIQRYDTHPRTQQSVVRELALDAGLIQSDDKHYLPASAPASTKTGETNMQPYILAIGDIFTDAFIKLDENYAKVEKDEDGNEWLKLPFGSKPPYERVDIVPSVGPSPNAAISCARLGLNVGLMAWLGDDEAGQESLRHLKDENVDTTTMVAQANTKSSYWYVLRHGSDRTMLVKSESYNYEWTAPEREPDWIYLSYIGKDSWDFHTQLLDYLHQHPSVKLVFQPGSYHFEWGVDKLAGIYERTHLVVMNREEVMSVTGRPHEDLRELAGGLHDLGPEVVVITDGAHGSYASHDGKMYSIPNYPDSAPPLDRTGAGDAFASTIVAALALGESIETALTWAPINSMNVVQKLGAQAGLLRRDEVEHYLQTAPEDYKAKEI